MSDVYLEYGDQKHPIAAGDPVTVGAGAACAVRIAGDGVEQEHATLRLEGGRVVLTSKVTGEHDARINGVAVHAAELHPGDKVRFGNVEGIFEVTDAGPALQLQGAAHNLVRGVNAIGRDPAGGVLLADESVSRKHAEVFILPSGQVRIRDLGSANGTVVNGRRLGERELAVGDEIRLGAAVLRLGRTEEAARPAVAAPAGVAEAKTVLGPRPGAGAAAATAPTAPKLELEFKGAKRTLKDGALRIGRAPDCDIVIDDDAQVSRYHAEVRVAADQAVVRDLGSSNGTRVNGEKVAGERPLQDGDRIGIGGQELVFSTEVPVTPFGRTVLAKDLSGAVGRTVLAPAAGAGRKGPGVVPTDRDSALAALDLPRDAGEGQVQQRYRELYSEFRIRLTNAPTQELKRTYERRLEELQAAIAILAPQAAAGASDLPAIEPVAAGREGASPPAAVSGPAPQAAAPPQAGVAPPPAAAAEKKKERAARRPIPRSTIAMAVVNVLLVGGAVFAALGASRAGRVAADLQTELAAKKAELAELEVAMPETVAAVEELAQSKGALLTNAQLKICNHSSRPLRWQWLNAAWFDEQEAGFRGFDTAVDTQWQYLFDERIEPGATFAGEWVVGEQRIWPGEAIFFAVLFVYEGRDVLRAGATPTLDGGCYPLNLDR